MSFNAYREFRASGGSPPSTSGGAFYDFNKFKEAREAQMPRGRDRGSESRESASSSPRIEPVVSSYGGSYSDYRLGKHRESTDMLSSEAEAVSAQANLINVKAEVAAAKSKYALSAAQAYRDSVDAKNLIMETEARDPDVLRRRHRKEKIVSGLKRLVPSFIRDRLPGGARQSQQMEAGESETGESGSEPEAGSPPQAFSAPTASKRPGAAESEDRFWRNISKDPFAPKIGTAAEKVFGEGNILSHLFSKKDKGVPEAVSFNPRDAERIERMHRHGEQIAILDQQAWIAKHGGSAEKAKPGE